MALNFWAKTDTAKKMHELYVYDSIGKDWYGDGITAQSVSDALREFPKSAALDVYINSPGGSVFEGVAIYNQLRRWAGKKTVHIDGIAASIASIIAMAGDERKIASNGIIMIHRAWGFAMGNAEDCRKYADSLEKIDGTLLDTYIERTGGNKKQIEDWMAAETWMNADEAVSRGFATEKTGDTTVKAEFPLLAKFNKVPEQLRRQAMQSNVLLAKVNARTATMNRPASRAGNS